MRVMQVVGGLAAGAVLLVVSAGAAAVELMQADAEAMVEAFLEHNPDAVELAPGAYETIGPNGQRAIHSFGVEGQRFDRERFQRRLDDARLRQKGGEANRREIAALESMLAAVGEPLEVSAKGVRTGYVCGEHPMTLIGSPGTGSSGQPLTFASAEVDFYHWGGGPPVPNPSVSAYAFATIYCESDDIEAVDTDVDPDSAHAQAQAVCPAGETADYWEAYLEVRAYVADVSCGYRSYNPSGNWN